MLHMYGRSSDEALKLDSPRHEAPDIVRMQNREPSADQITQPALARKMQNEARVLPPGKSL